jgi:hypothetical protein
VTADIRRSVEPSYTTKIGLDSFLPFASFNRSRTFADSETKDTMIENSVLSSLVLNRRRLSKY